MTLGDAIKEVNCALAHCYAQAESLSTEDQEKAKACLRDRLQAVAERLREVTSMSTFWYKVVYSSISKVEVVKETPKTLEIITTWGGKSRTERVYKSGYNMYFPTWKDARDYILKKAEDRVFAYEQNLRMAREGLLKVQSIPEVEPNDGKKD